MGKNESIDVVEAAVSAASARCGRRLLRVDGVAVQRAPDRDAYLFATTDDAGTTLHMSIPATVAHSPVVGSMLDEMMSIRLVLEWD